MIFPLSFDFFYGRHLLTMKYGNNAPPAKSQHFSLFDNKTCVTFSVFWYIKFQVLTKLLALLFHTRGHNHTILPPSLYWCSQSKKCYQDNSLSSILHSSTKASTVYFFELTLPIFSTKKKIAFSQPELRNFSSERTYVCMLKPSPAPTLRPQAAATCGTHIFTHLSPSFLHILFLSSFLILFPIPIQFLI